MKYYSNLKNHFCRVRPDLGAKAKHVSSIRAEKANPFLGTTLDTSLWSVSTYIGELKAVF
jgi:hypothetical protein